MIERRSPSNALRDLLNGAAVAFVLFTGLSSCLTVTAFSSDLKSISTRSSLSTQELSEEIGSRLMRVPEFDFIRHEAELLGVKAYLFGGTAAGYAHYVKWDLLREKGDKRYQPNRFDYDYTNIYRSTQDLDIVIDGNAEQAAKLQSALQEKYPHLQGSKTAWEVRLLTQDMGDKQAILNNPDFLNQHTDSNSTGLIEITKPTHGDPVVRDVRDWNAKEPYFLKDIYDGTLHYYFSTLHDSTKFAKEGRNPPILSAIRFLTKAFQYELKIKPDDFARIQKIIAEFDPKQATKNAYVANWIEKNGKKLIQNAVNIEYARDTLDQLGLREKLSSIKDNAGVQDSLAWWLSKEPLRSAPVGSGTGKTAKELALDQVAHETNSYLAYESITRAHTGAPNVLISRHGAAGEAAAYGDGFYTRVGREGARGTGLTIRFHLDPNAREATDFEKAGSEYIIVKNKSALKVIPESLNIGPVEYMQMILAGKAGDSSDLGIRERMGRRLKNKQNILSTQEREKLLDMLRTEIQKPEISQDFLKAMHDIFPKVYNELNPQISDRLRSHVLQILQNADKSGGDMPKDFGWAMEHMSIDRPAEMIKAFIDLDTKQLKYYGQFNLEFWRYLQRFPSQNELISAYDEILASIPALNGSVTPTNVQNGRELHQSLLQWLSENDISQIRPFLEEQVDPRVKMYALEFLEKGLKSRNRTLDWAHAAMTEALQSGDDAQAEVAIRYLTTKDTTLSDAEAIVHQVLLNSVSSNSGNRLASASSYFKKHPPKDDQVILSLAQLASTNSSLSAHLSETVGNALRGRPALVEQISNTDLLARANCHTERCIQLYLKDLDLKHVPADRVFQGQLIVHVGHLEHLKPPVDDRIASALVNTFSNESVTSYSRSVAAFAYVSLGGSDPEIIQKAIAVVDEHFFKYANFLTPFFKERKELRHKMEQKCIIQSIRMGLQN
jgi:hypothetical protein